MSYKYLFQIMHILFSCYMYLDKLYWQFLFFTFQGTELEPNTLPFWVQLRYAQLSAGDTKGAERTQEMIDKLRTQHW